LPPYMRKKISVMAPRRGLLAGVALVAIAAISTHGFPGFSICRGRPSGRQISAKAVPHGVAQDDSGGTGGPSLMTSRRLWLATWAIASSIVPTATLAAAPPNPLGSTELFLVDETNLLAPSTEKYLEKLLRKLQEDTGLKLRVICPPTGLQNDRDEFSEYLKPISKKLGTDPSSLVILCEERFQKRTGRPLPLMTLQAGFRLQERFQYRLTNDFLLSVADKYGFPKTVDQTGPDFAIQEATKNVAAALYGLSDDPTKRFLRAVPDEEVPRVLKKHGL